MQRCKKRARQRRLVYFRREGMLRNSTASVRCVRPQKNEAESGWNMLFDYLMPRKNAAVQKMIYSRRCGPPTAGLPRKKIEKT